MIETGITGRHEEVVTYELTAAKVGSGLVEVYATPMMIALMEKTCAQTVEPYLDEGDGTVGTLVNVTHSAATPVGMKVWCECELVEVDRRRLVFKAIIVAKVFTYCFKTLQVLLRVTLVQNVV